MNITDEQRKIVEAISTRLADEGKVIEGGWAGLCVIWKLDKAPAMQRAEMRKAFFAGAQHLFGTMMTIMEPGAEPTEKDMDRMAKIFAEMETFKQQLEGELNN